MRICMVTDCDVSSGGGTVEVIYNLALKLVEMGHSIAIAAPRYPTAKAITPAPNDAQNIFFPIRKIPGLTLINMTESLVKTVVAAHKRHNFDILHLFHAIPLGHTCLMLRDILGIRLVTSLMGTDSFSPSSSFAQRVTRPLASLIVNASDAVTSPSKDLALLAQGNRHQPRIEVIPHGVDVGRFTDLSASNLDSLRNNWGIRGNEFVILSITRAAPVKNAKMLILASPKVIRTYSKTRFVVVGVGGEVTNLLELAESLHVRPYFTFVGRVPRKDIPAFHIMSDVFVSTSLWESFGLAILEAMAAGKPVIAPNVGAIPEIIVNKATGFLYPSGNLEILSDLIVRLLGDKKLRLELGRIGKRRAAANFSWTESAKRYEALYKGLC